MGYVHQTLPPKEAAKAINFEAGTSREQQAFQLACTAWQFFTGDKPDFDADYSEESENCDRH